MSMRIAVTLALSCLLVACRNKGAQEASSSGSAADHAGMVLIAGGAFEMGCRPEKDPGCKKEEQPAHQVKLSPYWIDLTEVTQKEYSRCVQAGKCTPPSTNFTPDVAANHPVTNVNWQQAADACAFFGKRLPTEAEWEKAARGTDGRLYPWGDEPPDCDRADYMLCQRPPQPVGSHPSGKSPYGVLDMAGSVEEWVQDWFDAAYYASSPAADPPGPPQGDGRVGRGGAYDPWHLRSTARNFLIPSHDDHLLGFRCARSGS